MRRRPIGDTCGVSAVSTQTSTVSLVLPPEAESPGRLRRQLQRSGLDPDIDHTVTLLASELVANAINHAGGGEIRVAATLGPSFARLEVLDTGSGFDPEVRHGSQGFGLRLVDKLATRWGVERGEGTVVWFEVDRRRRRFHRDTDG